jgi:hypothetical protein
MSYVIFSGKLDDYARDYKTNKVLLFKRKEVAEAVLKRKTTIKNIEVIGIERDSKVIEY